VKLLIQPGDGIGPLVKAIGKARKRVEIVIFRFDRIEIERALEDAVKRGVFVHALIAYTNRGGEKNLRRLEMRFLAAGITVARTSNDLVRYHGKMMIIDGKQLYLLAFNLTRLDLDHSRSFGIVTSNRQLVQEATKLFEKDTKRQPYTPGSARFLVSPLNARKQLAAFIHGAKKELLIYDMKIADRAMTRLLEERAKAGVEVRIIGKVTRKTNGLTVRKLNGMRLHARTIVRDQRQLFIGSQSLRELELDARREIGIIFSDRKIIASVMKVFEADWRSAASPRKEPDTDLPDNTAASTAKKVAKSIARELPPVGPVMEKVLKEVASGDSEIEIDPKELQSAVRDAVRDSVKEVVQEVIVEVANGKEPVKDEPQH
jgi:phosphatidylserine/phosphatidylglycerophosphate/cardiolipin synthase-like enzyme